MNEVERIRDLISSAARFLVVSHIRPDGDAIGSLLGLGCALQAAGKHVQMVDADGVPLSLRYLESSNQVRNSPEGAFDLIIVVDCSDLRRTGNTLNGYKLPDINIDHHATNELFAQINLVDSKAVSTTEIIYDHLDAWGLPLTKDVSDALLMGLITDTIGFRTPNVTPKALRIAANLMEAGSDLANLYQQALINRSYEAIRFWGAGLSVLERRGPVIWTTLTMDDRKAAGYGGRDDADLINLLSSINDVEICVVFIEQPNEHVKVSWRSQPGIDVSRVASGFGGGGHPSAAGAEITGDLEQVRSLVLQETFRLINNDHKEYYLNGMKNE